MRIDYLPKVAEINSKLEQLFGKHPVKNQANFRLAYAGDQYEHRSGEFNVYVGDIFLRTESGIREVKKYSYLDDDTFIMERLIGNHHQDVMEGDYIYECFYAFRTGLLPPLKAVIFCMNMLLVVGGTAPKTQKEAEDRADKELAEAKVKTREFLDTHLDYTDISMKIKHGAGISMSGLDAMKYDVKKELMKK